MCRACPLQRPRVFLTVWLLLISCMGCLTAAAGGQDTLLQPGNLGYLGAFRLPEGDDGWSYGGGGLAYYPGGDPGGGADGYPGSLFGIGNDQQNEITEISIPAPVRSAAKRVDDLNAAKTLQPFTPIFPLLFTPADDGLPRRADLAYLPAQPGQQTGRLYLTWGEHYQYDQVPSHAMCSLDLSKPQVEGPWYIAEYENYATDDYLFPIPEKWASEHTPGLRLATGRFRDGSLGGSGPALFAIGPWNDGNPPPRNARLTHVTPLLLYAKGYEPGGAGRVMQGYTSADEWAGGEWVTSGAKSAVIFAGTRGRGRFWYGFSNGVVWPDNPPYPEYPPAPHNDRGWWAESFDGVLLFYNPDDLAKAATGTMAPYEPQPYAELALDPYLWHITGPVQKMHLGDIAFDPDREILYVIEPFADGDRPIIHVFSLGGKSPVNPGQTLPLTTAYQTAPEKPAPEGSPPRPRTTQVIGFEAAIAVTAVALSLHWSGKQ